MKKNPSLGRKGAGQNLTTVRTNTTSNLADQLDLFPVQSLKPQIRSVGINPSCKHCGCQRGYLFKGNLLCCRCDRTVQGGSN